MRALARVAPFARVDLPFALLAAAVLVLGLFYTLGYVLAVPYPGVDFNAAWQVLAFDNPCDVNPDWCAARDRSLQIGDRLLAIGDLTYEEYRAHPTRIPFWGYQPGELVPITFERDGVVRQISWPMLGPSGETRSARLIGVLIFLPFWLAGTAVLLFLRPRNTLWCVLIAFNYLTALWIASGIPSVYGFGASALVLVAMTWLMVPVYLHLHLLAPEPLFPRSYRYLLPPLYALGCGMALLQFLTPVPSLVNNLALLVALLGSLALLMLRVMRRGSPEAGPALRLMLVGVGLAFGLGVILWVVPNLVTSSAASRLAINIMMVAIALLPFFYVYALYKHRLGAVEFRANRILSLISFLTLYITIFLFVFVLGTRWVHLTSAALAFSLVTSVIFVTIGVFLRAPLQRWIDRLAYGTVHNPNDIIRTFANEIPRALSREALVKLITGQVMPSLLIRQSALYQLGGEGVSLLYAEKVELDPKADVEAEVRQLLEQSGRYRPPEPEDRSTFAWVRLPVAIEVGGKRTGVWLLGQRDPDDFYPQPDIELLAVLANQVGVALDNARLFENLRLRAAELQQAYDELQELDRLKDEFVQNVSHELRTPLTIINGYISLLLEGTLGDLSAEQREAVDIIADRTGGIIRLVNDIISIQQNALEALEREPVNLAVLAQSSLRTAEVMAGKQRPEVHYEFVLDAADDVPPVWADRRRLGQVFDNLLSNAVKFSPDGGRITVTIRAVRHCFEVPGSDGSPQAAVQVSISDQGIGIPADKIGRIWERFFQLDGSSRRRFGGLGLGLAIVRNIIEAHSGVVWAESTVGVGSTFHFVLPTVETAMQILGDLDE